MRKIHYVMKEQEREKKAVFRAYERGAFYFNGSLKLHWRFE